MAFSDDMNELEKIRERFESGNLSVEESLAEFESAVKLIRKCQTFLSDAKQKVSLLTEEGEVQLPGAASVEEERTTV